ncbi:SDR family oxidoreductase (plasmid) [Paenibacillus rhizovicinus]|uniref:SDR family oxidoreductase n=1 Tax=Paenibacillus rhizovicinus TaxID=2704463 RepID=A0A6C0PAL2_9BACL|nr:SDR family oxidoreductase [Paenibacillus rhizovicinus]QHW35529.1 SDR family oxidoreductase [Paenibacillus rhizovicinus]
MAQRGRLAGKSVIITGAASGIGLGTAELFMEEGAKLVLVDLQPEMLEQAVTRLHDASGECVSVCGDVSEPYTITRAVQRAIETYGKIDVVFNNAGIMPTGPVTEYPDESWDRVMAVNLKSMFMMCKMVIPEMLKQGGGSIVNMSSVMAGLTEPGYTAYTASKAGIIGLTKEIAVSYSEQGIRCNAICPGWVDTEMNRKVAEDMGGMDKLQPLIKRQQPLGRMATVREVGYAVLFLASDESTAVSGSCLYVDGASSASI